MKQYVENEQSHLFQQNLNIIKTIEKIFQP